MLALVEPCIWKYLLDRPDLGCAMLVAACQEKGIKTALIKGQTRYLKDMFVNDSEELWALIQDLKENDFKQIGLDKDKTNILEQGLKPFQNELKSLYQYVVVDKSPRHYFNAQIFEKFNNFYNIFINIYSYYIKKIKHIKLNIVDRYVLEIIKTKPQYIGFSLQDQFDFLALAVRKRIKERTKIPIIVGGAFSAFINFEKMKEIFEEGYFDYLVIGAGEYTLPSLISALENKKEPVGITNVFYKQCNQIKGNDSEIIYDLDKLPYPDYSQFDLDLYLAPKRILPLQTARGCSWRKCAFCAHHSIYHGKYMPVRYEKLIKIIKHLQSSYDCSHFVFHDDELPSGRAKKISEAILENELKDVSIYSYARLTDGYNNSKLLSSLRKAGFSTFAWGLESGDQRILDLMRKGIKTSTAGHILEKASKNGITNLCFVLFGFPGETKQEAEQTVEFLKKHADYIDDIMHGPFTLESLSPIGKNPTMWGLTIKRNGIFSTKSGMSRKTLKAFISHLGKELEFNTTKLCSKKIKYLLPGFNRRMQHFINSSYKLYSSISALDCLAKGRLNSIFPIILGEIQKKNNKVMFYPINTAETISINHYYPEKEFILDKLDEKIFVLSEGRLSIEDIITTIYDDFKGEYRRKYIRKKCLDLFQKIFSRNLALGYAKSWQSF